MLRALVLLPVLVIIAAVLIILTACKSSSSAPAAAGSTPRTPAMTDLLGDWTLSKLEGQDVASLIPAQARKPSLSFLTDGKVTGDTGVNRLSSSLDLAALTKGEFKLGPAITTRMASTIPESNALEHKFTAALQQVTRAKVDGNTLTLGDGAKELLTLVRGK